jgi:hypothetical protein
MGAPVGARNDQTALTFPEWLTTVSALTRLRWARTYVILRATPFSEGHGDSHQCKEARTQQGTLFQELAPPEMVRTTNSASLLRPSAARELDAFPTLPKE